MATLLANFFASALAGPTAAKHKTTTQPAITRLIWFPLVKLADAIHDASACVPKVITGWHRALRPQPGGFEGLGAVGEPFETDRLSVAERVYKPVAERDACATRLATGLSPKLRNDRVGSGFDDFAELERDFFPSPGRLDLEVPNGFCTADRRVLGPLTRRKHLSSRIDRGEPGSLVAPVEGVHDLAHALDVLLRHRPRSISLRPKPDGLGSWTTAGWRRTAPGEPGTVSRWTG